MEDATGNPHPIDPPHHGNPLEVGRADLATPSKKDNRREEERKQDQRQNGGRDDAGDDEDLARSEPGRGIESAS